MTADAKPKIAVTIQSICDFRPARFDIKSCTVARHSFAPTLYSFRLSSVFTPAFSAAASAAASGGEADDEEADEEPAVRLTAGVVR